MKKTIGKKIGWIIFSFILLELLLILAIITVNVLSEYKVDMTTNVLIGQYKDTFTQLPRFIQNNWQERNVLFIGGTIVSLIYSMYLAFNNRSKKEGWDTEARNTYHGSAHWAVASEIFDTKNFLNKNKKEVLSDFEESLKKGNTK